MKWIVALVAAVLFVWAVLLLINLGIAIAHLPGGT